MAPRILLGGGRESLRFVEREVHSELWDLRLNEWVIMACCVTTSRKWNALTLASLGPKLLDDMVGISVAENYLVSTVFIPFNVLVTWRVCL